MTMCLFSLISMKYGNFQYNGISSLKPNLGEVTAFLTETVNTTNPGTGGPYRTFTVMLNANQDGKHSVNELF